MTFAGMTIDGHSGSAVQVSGTTVSSGYFSTLGIPLLRGRLFANADREGAPGVVLVNQLFVRRYLPNEEDLGRRIEDPNRKNAWPTTMDVVADVRPYPAIHSSPSSCARRAIP